MYPSLESRKRAEADRRAGLADILAGRLAPFARRHGGRFILFGSLARGEARYDSDVDLLLDFPSEHEAAAWRLAEDLCAEFGIELDIKPVAWCEPAFVAKVLPGARLIA